MNRPKILTKQDLDDWDKMLSSYKYRAEYNWINPMGGHTDSFCTTILGYGDDKEELIKSVLEINGGNSDYQYDYDDAKGFVHHDLEESPAKFIVVKNN